MRKIPRIAENGEVFHRKQPRRVPVKFLIGWPGHADDSASGAKRVEKMDDRVERQAHLQNAMQAEQALKLQGQATDRQIGDALRGCGFGRLRKRVAKGNAAGLCGKFKLAAVFALTHMAVQQNAVSRHGNQAG